MINKDNCCRIFTGLQKKYYPDQVNDGCHYLKNKYFQHNKDMSILEIFKDKCIDDIREMFSDGENIYFFAVYTGNIYSDCGFKSSFIIGSGRKPVEDEYEDIEDKFETSLFVCFMDDIKLKNTLTETETNFCCDKCNKELKLFYKNKEGKLKELFFEKGKLQNGCKLKLEELFF